MESQGQHIFCLLESKEWHSAVYIFIYVGLDVLYQKMTYL